MTTKKKPPPVGDVTRTARAHAHLERLSEAKGKRLVVDLDAEGRQALEAIVDHTGATQKEVVQMSLIAAHKKISKKA